MWKPPGHLLAKTGSWTRCTYICFRLLTLELIRSQFVSLKLQKQQRSEPFCTNVDIFYYLSLSNSLISVCSNSILLHVAISHYYLISEFEALLKYRVDFCLCVTLKPLLSWSLLSSTHWDSYFLIPNWSEPHTLWNWIFSIMVYSWDWEHYSNILAQGCQTFGGGWHPRCEALCSAVYKEKGEGFSFIADITLEVMSKCQWCPGDTLFFLQKLYGKSQPYHRVFAQIQHATWMRLVWWCHFLCNVSNEA